MKRKKEASEMTGKYSGVGQKNEKLKEDVRKSIEK